ncbi:Ig-like domain repeat protein [Sanguibacter massiliensis]|uniref:Ig-like domain repeat protein n=1 Tax=Sanguibacter massiliensis TaxID=1973217 RepID=UPI00101AD427|nr:Ig-like domain repeat protein [Sanguibacter massiliensis]
MPRKTWGAVCALALTLTGIPAVTAAASPGPVDDLVVRGTLVATLGSGRDAAGRPVETTGLGIRTEAGSVVRLDADVPAAALVKARPGDTVKAVVGVPADVPVAALRGSRPDAPAGALTRAGDLKARSIDVLQAAPVAAAPRPGAHSAYLVRVDDAAATGEFTLAEGRAAVSRGSDYWTRETGKIVNGLTVRGEATLTTSNVCAELANGDYFKVWERAQKLLPGVDASRAARTHLIVMVPRSCYDDGSIGWTGLATIGSGLTSGGLVFLAADDAHTVSHELGHNFGLGHSNLEIGDADGAIEYFGIHSVMGASSSEGTTTYAPPVLDPAFREVLDILPGSSVTAGSPGVDTRVRAVSGRSPLSLRFVDQAGRTIYLELRDGGGNDAGAYYASPWAIDPAYDLGTGVRFSTIVRDSRGVPSLVTLGGSSDGVAWATVHAGESVRSSSLGRTVMVRSISGGTAVVGFSTPAESRATMSKISVRYGRSTKVSVKVTGETKPQGVVRFYVGTKRVATAKVSSSGRATATLPASVRPGKQTVTARYSGDVMLAGSRAKRTVKVTKGLPSIKVTKAAKVRKGSKATLTVRVGTVAGTRPHGTVRAKVGKKYVSKSAKIVRSGKYWVAKVRTSRLPRGKVALVYTPAKSTSKLLATRTVSSGYTAR